MLVSHRQRLIVLRGANVGLEKDFSSTHITIGTAESNDFVLSDPTVSRRHCELSVLQDKYLVRDLGSTNGTLVNGTPVVEAFLAPGAKIRVGETEILFEPKKRWERVQEAEVDHFGALYGRSAAMRSVFGLLSRVAATDLSCLVVGETGTGKELAARGLHQNSKRASKPFVVVDCGAISATLIESELFGHERGAFTGADRQRQGAFEVADTGTIFLDEIGELPLELQPKLLRVLETREVRRVGSTTPIKVDIRVVSATHRDLVALVEQGKFREDLYYRLAEVVIKLPPLRARKDDIALLAERMLSEPKHREGGQRAHALSPEALQSLLTRAWPGNVRELRNVLRRAGALAQGPVLSVEDLNAAGGLRPLSGLSGASSAFDESTTQQHALHAPEPSAAVEHTVELSIKEAREKWVEPMEREYLVQLLKRFGKDLDAAAQHAGIHRKSLERLLRQHNIRRKADED
jgi:DNA-binding NtrC family response regulator